MYPSEHGIYLKYFKLRKIFSTPNGSRCCCGLCCCCRVFVATAAATVPAAAVAAAVIVAVRQASRVALHFPDRGVESGSHFCCCFKSLWYLCSFACETEQCVAAESKFAGVSIKCQTQYPAKLTATATTTTAAATVQQQETRQFKY